MRAVLIALHADANTKASLAFSYLTAYARTDPKVSDRVIFEILNYHVDGGPRDDEIAAEVLAHLPDIVGFSAYVWNIERCLIIAKKIRRERPDTVIVFGGPEVASETLPLFDENSADYLVIGDGEEPFRALCQRMLDGCLDDADVWPAGIIKRDNGRFRWDGRIGLAEDLAAIPSPFLVEGYRPAEGHTYWETARGCQFRCAFCLYNKYSPSVRPFPLDRLIAELKVFERLKVPRVFLLDPTFNGNPRRAKQILRAIAEHNPSTLYHGELRAELLDDETVSLLREAHFEFIEVGLQSANPTALKLMDRPTNLPRFSDGISKLKQAGLYFETHLIIGLPGDNYETYCDSVDFAMRLVPPHISVFRLQALPGTTFRRRATEFGLEHEQRAPYAIVRSTLWREDDLERASRLVEPAPVLLESIPHTLNLIFNGFGLRPSILLQHMRAAVEEMNAPRGAASHGTMYEALGGILRTLLTERDEIEAAMSLLTIESGRAMAAKKPLVARPLNLPDSFGEDSRVWLRSDVIVARAMFDLARLARAPQEWRLAMRDCAYLHFNRTGKVDTIQIEPPLADMLEFCSTPRRWLDVLATFRSRDTSPIDAPLRQAVFALAEEGIVDLA